MKTFKSETLSIAWHEKKSDVKILASWPRPTLNAAADKMNRELFREAFYFINFALRTASINWYTFQLSAATRKPKSQRFDLSNES